MKRPKTAELVAPPPVEKPPRPLPVYAGDVERKCSNCQHFERPKHGKKVGDCHNGISGRIATGTRSIDGCAYGFYPSIEKFPLKAGTGGSR